jgi:Tol biopolymer transport system component
MKTQKVILGLIVFFFVCCGFIFAQPFETIQIGDGTQKFRNPVWSPDGEKLAFWGPGGIYVCKWDSSEQPKKIIDAFGERLTWVNDTLLVYWQRRFIKIEQEGKRSKKETRESLRIVTLNGEEKIIQEGKRASAPCRLREGLIVYYRDGEPYDILTQTKVDKDTLANLLTVVSHFPHVYDPITKKPKYEDTDIWIESLDGSFKKRVTYGKSYYFPQLSPDGTKILAKKPNFGLVVLNLNGDETEVASGSGEVISSGVFKGIIGSTAQWSPNDSLIVYVETRETGEEVLGSELFVTTAEGMEKRQLTDTPDETETDPIWSPDGDKIVYWTENSGKIYVTKIK